MKIRNAFTMIELIFVIVIMGIIAKFGVEFLAQAYNSFIYSSVNNTLQSKSATAVEFIASRLQYRIKDSVIARTGQVTVFDSITDINPNKNYTVLEWVSTDNDNFRGSNVPNWSGIIDLDNASASANILVSPETNTTKVNTMISTLSYGFSGIANAALYFIGANTNINGFGWDGLALTNQTSVMHPIQATAIVNQFTSSIVGTTFANVDVYEYYKLAWTANAIAIENYDPATKTFDLVYYYNYQPWAGDKFYDTGTNIHKAVIMKGISTFRFTAIGSIMKIQVCAKSKIISGKNDNQGYSLCKEKTIF